MTARILVAPIAVAAAAVLTACGGGGGETSEQARDRFYAALDATQEALGGEWEVRDDTTARGCSLPLWTDGQSYPGLRLGPMPDDVSAAVTTARDALRERGYDTTIGDVGTVAELRARGNGTEVITFRVADDGMTLQGESDCRPR